MRLNAEIHRPFSAFPHFRICLSKAEDVSMF